MEFIETTLRDALLIEPRVFGDDRGFFMESWNSRTFADAGLDLTFMQDNHSRSQAGVLRGLHYQQPNPQGKLVRVTQGAVYDVIVDLRKGSETFGQHEGFTLSADNKRMLWVPPGFAHGFLTLEDDTHFLYKCTAQYDPSAEHSLLWNDDELAIDWPLDGRTPTLSAKDEAGVPFAEAVTFA